MSPMTSTPDPTKWKYIAGACETIGIFLAVALMFQACSSCEREKMRLETAERIEQLKLERK